MEREPPIEDALYAQCGDCMGERDVQNSLRKNDNRVTVCGRCCHTSSLSHRQQSSPRHMSCPKGSHWWQKGRRQVSIGLGRYRRSNVLLTDYYNMPMCAYVLLLVCSLTVGPVTAEDGLQFDIPEEGQVGMFVGNVLEGANLAGKYNNNPDILNQLRFQFLRGEQPGFAINNSTGVIYTTQMIDREGGPDMTCANQPVCDIKLDVAVQPPQYFQIIRVTVRITDINDHSPVFSEQRVTHRMLESSQPGTNILTFNVQDLDSPDFSIQRFELLPTTTSKFRVTNSLQPDGSREVRLKLLEALDRETVSEYNLRIVAYDGGAPLQTGSVDVQIVVLDTNDNNPTFTTATYEVDVLENVHIPHRVIQVVATDPDSGSNGEITYGFRTSTLRSHGDVFEIDEDTGEIFLTKAVDYEQTPVYHLGVTAIDKGPVAVASDATVIVKIVDVNDHAPSISVSTLSPDGRAIVAENAPVGSFVSHLSVSDLDSGNNAIVTCSLDSEHFSLEYMYDTEYQMVSAQVFDREDHDQYTVIVTCSDQGSEPKASSKNIHVSVSDVNDHVPVFEHDVYYGELLENSFQGAVAIQVKATDADIGVNGQVIYTMDPGLDTEFTVDEVSGEVKARRGLDRELRASYELTVYATDQGEPFYTNSTKVIVQILDVNDRSPAFSQPNYSFGVFENEPAGTDVGALSAEDKDAAPFNRFNFTFIDGSTEFDIDPKNGRITTKRVLDREEQDVYHLIAGAVEEGKRFTSTVSLSIYVADINDNSPTFVFPNSINNSVFISKDIPHGYIATRLEAHDADIANNAGITYDIVSADEEGVFDIDTSRGTILVIRELTTYEDVVFHLNVSATDNGAPRLTSYANINIVVNGTMPIQPRPADPQYERPMGSTNNLVIVIALASTSGVITIILVAAIICIRRQDRRHDPTPTSSNGKYNCRMEALRFLNIHRRNKKQLVGGGSTSSGSTSGSSSGGGGPGCGDEYGKSSNNKKEVSFSLEADDHPSVEISEHRHDKSKKSWSSVIDHNTLQTPRACSSLLNTAQTPPYAVGQVGNGRHHPEPVVMNIAHHEGLYDRHGHAGGTMVGTGSAACPTNGAHHHTLNQLGPSQRELERRGIIV